MPTYTLALIRSTLKDQVSKSSLVALAKTIGVNALGLKKVIAGKATPNVRTADKYAKHLGITTTELNQVLDLATKKKPAAKAKAGKKTAKNANVEKTAAVKSATGKRRGRPPGSGNKKAAAGKTSTVKAPAEKAAPGKRRGRPPGAAKAKSAAPVALKKSDSIVSTFLELMDALTTPDTISSDKLALAVHGASEGQRKLIQALVNAF